MDALAEDPAISITNIAHYVSKEMQTHAKTANKATLESISEVEFSNANLTVLITLLM